MTGPQAGGFRVDTDGMSGAITELEDALAELRRIRDDVRLLQDVRPPSKDQVSADAAHVLGMKANGGGSMAAALEAGIAQVTETIDALRTATGGYESADTPLETQLR